MWQIVSVVIVTVVKVAVVTLVIVTYFSKNNLTPRQPMRILRAAVRDIAMFYMFVLSTYLHTLLCFDWASSNASGISSTSSLNLASCLDAWPNTQTPCPLMTSVTTPCLMSSTATFMCSASYWSWRSLSSTPLPWIVCYVGIRVAPLSLLWLLYGASRLS